MNKGDILGYTMDITDTNGERYSHFHHCYMMWGDYTIHSPIPFYWDSKKTITAAWRVREVKKPLN